MNNSSTSVQVIENNHEAAHTLDKDSEVCIRALNTIAEMLTDTAAHIESSTTELSNRFQSMAESAMTQSDQVRNIIEVATSLSVDNEKISLLEFTELFQKTLRESIDRIINVAKTSMDLVFTMSEAIENMKGLKSCVDNIQRINKQTNMLALNAIIEAARAGEAGKGFSVVANEVKEISGSINTLAKDMHEKIGKVSEDVRRSYEQIKVVASMDMTEQVVAQEKLNALIQALLDQSTDLSKILGNTADESKELSRAISGLVVNMQFQDRACQYIDNSIKIMGVIAKHISDNSTEYHSLTSEEKSEKLIEDIVNCCLLSEFKNTFYSKSNIASLEILESGAAQGLSSGEDDIELF